MNEEWRQYSYSEKKINNLAKYIAFNRLSRMGVNLSDAFDEIKQELSIAWLEAVEKYDPDKGASFSTFLYIGMLRRVNRFISNNYELEPASQVNTLLSLENEQINIASNNDQASKHSSHFLIDQNLSVLAKLEQKSCYKLVLRNLSERAKQFVEFLCYPPIELIRALDDLTEKAKYARSKGYSYSAVKRVSANIIFKIMGAEQSERNRIIKEIRNQAMSIL